jgi:hypothetical protein
MTILLLCAYTYRITGDAAHEWIGVSVFVLVVAHNVINFQWYKNILKGKYTLRRIIMTTVNIVMAVDFAALFITGLLHSRTVLAFLRLPGGMVLRLIHTTAAYWLLPLTGIHLGLHWGMVARRISNNRLTITIACICAFLFAAFGVWSSFDRNMFSKLFLGFSFDYWPEERSAVLFFAVMLSIVGVYVFITHYALKGIERKHKRE